MQWPNIEFSGICLLQSPDMLTLESLELMVPALIHSPNQLPCCNQVQVQGHCKLACLEAMPIGTSSIMSDMMAQALCRSDLACRTS